MTATKKRSFLIYFLVFLFAVTAIVAYSPQALSAKAAENSQFVVVIDPGRGYESGEIDSGTIVDGVIESNLNVTLSDMIVAQLNNMGFDVYTTRALPNVPASRTLLSGTNYSLQDRVNAANSKYADIFLSVHMNSYNKPFNSASGASVLYDGAQSGYTKSKALATTVYSNISSLSGVKGNRSQPVYSAAETVLRGSNCPAAMLEAGFMTNMQDLNRLRDNSQMQSLAAQAANGIAQYLGVNGSSNVEPTGGRDTDVPTCTAVTTSETYTSDPDFVVTAHNVSDRSGIMDVYFQVYPGTNVSLMETVDGDEMGGNNWEGDFNVEDLFTKPTGRITINAYAEDYAGNVAKLGTVSVNYTPDRKAPAMAGLKSGKTTSTSPKFKLTAMGVIDPSGVKSVVLKVYPKGKKSQTKLVPMVAQKGNKWLKTTNVAQLFGKKKGSYVFEIWGTDKQGNTGKMGSRTFIYKPAK